MINILFFARLKDQLQTESLQVELQESVNTIEELKQWLIAEHGYTALDDETLRAAVNQKFCDFSSSIKSGDEIAFMPPVTGG